MSEDIATLGIRVDSTAVRDADNDLDKLTKSGGRAEKATDGLKSAFGGLKTVLAGLGIAALLREAGQLADTYSNITGKLSLVTTGTAELTRVTEQLFDVAQRSRVGFEATTDLYASLARSTKALGTSQADLMSVTETINKALVVSGASAATAEGALRQLGQGFASGALRGDELNSVLEGTPRLAQAIAEGMGVTIGQLRSLGAEGKITGEAVFNALRSQRQAVEDEFAKMPTTIAQSFTQLENEILRYVGQANEASGASLAVAGAISLVAKNIDVIVPVVGALAAALGVGFVANAVAASIAATGATGALTGMAVAAKGAGSALLGAFGGPVGLAITGVTLAIVGFAAESAKAKNAVDAANRSYAEMKQTLATTVGAANDAAKGSASVGSSASGAIPGVNDLSTAVRALADNLYRQADASKKARIEMATTALAKAREDEAAALANTRTGRMSQSFVRGDVLNNVGVVAGNLWAGTANVLSGGRIDREYDEAYKARVAASVLAQKNLDETYKSANTGSGVPNAGRAIAGTSKGSSGGPSKASSVGNDNQAKASTDATIASEAQANAIRAVNEANLDFIRNAKPTISVTEMIAQAHEKAANDTVTAADTLLSKYRSIADSVRSGTSTFGEAFGEAGRGIESLVNSFAEGAERSQSIMADLARARRDYAADSDELMEAEKDARRKLASNELASYGQVISGVKGLFKEKSAAYKVMQAAEQAYATVRLALAIKELVTEGLLTTTKVAGAGARMATDAAETGSSVANSGIRAAADGVAAFAKTLASLPFPFNLVAGAAVLAALVAVGVKIAGGGGGGGGKGKASDALSEAPPTVTDYTRQDSPYSVLQGTPSGSVGSASVPRSFNDNGNAGSAGAGNVTIAPVYQIEVNGNDDPMAVADTVRGVLAEHTDYTVNKAREAVRQDRMAESARQFIGSVR